VQVDVASDNGSDGENGKGGSDPQQGNHEGMMTAPTGGWGGAYVHGSAHSYLFSDCGPGIDTCG
jgi:hypothetical protein